jgi:hypothetical protein
MALRLTHNLPTMGIVQHITTCLTFWAKHFTNNKILSFYHISRGNRKDSVLTLASTHEIIANIQSQ